MFHPSFLVGCIDVTLEHVPFWLISHDIFLFDSLNISHFNEY